jgi:uncharacterized UPF0160 family protein
MTSGKTRTSIPLTGTTMTQAIHDTAPIRIATHNGTFHADDVFGVAVLQLLHPGAELVRTRDPETISKADFAVDVGGEWDPARGRFDHHQRGFAGARPSGVVYASAGLVWERFGAALVERMFSLRDPALAQAVANDLDTELVQHLDRADTGASHGAPGLFGLSALVSQLNAPWDAAPAGNKDGQAALALANFRKAMEVTTLLLGASLDQLRAKHQGAQLVRKAEKHLDGAVLLMPLSGLPWADVVSVEMPEVLFVVYPDSSDKQFQLHIVPVEPHSFRARKDLPSSWAGLRGADLARVSGVDDAVFCHNARFIGGAQSLKGAMQMAALAVASDS